MRHGGDREELYLALKGRKLIRWKNASQHCNWEQVKHKPGIGREPKEAKVH